MTSTGRDANDPEPADSGSNPLTQASTQLVASILAMVPASQRYLPGMRLEPDDWVLVSADIGNQLALLITTVEAWVRSRCCR